MEGANIQHFAVVGMLCRLVVDNWKWEVGTHSTKDILSRLQAVGNRDLVAHSNLTSRRRGMRPKDMMPKGMRPLVGTHCWHTAVVGCGSMRRNKGPAQGAAGSQLLVGPTAGCRSDTGPELALLVDHRCLFRNSRPHTAVQAAGPPADCRSGTAGPPHFGSRSGPRLVGLGWTLAARKVRPVGRRCKRTAARKQRGRTPRGGTWWSAVSPRSERRVRVHTHARARARGARRDNSRPERLR